MQNVCIPTGILIISHYAWLPRMLRALLKPISILLWCSVPARDTLGPHRIWSSETVLLKGNHFALSFQTSPFVTQVRIFLLSSGKTTGGKTHSGFFTAVSRLIRKEKSNMMYKRGVRPVWKSPTEKAGMDDDKKQIKHKHLRHWCLSTTSAFRFSPSECAFAVYQYLPPTWFLLL